MKRLVQTIILIVLGLSLTVVPFALAQDSSTTTSVSTAPNALTQIYDQVSPSVVAINVLATRTDQMGQQGTIAGAGSGFVIDTDGHIVTNNHVVEGATRIEVNFLDGTIVRGEVVGLDPDSDLAVVQVDLPAAELHPVTFGDSSALEIGQPVLAIGSPFGQRWTLTSGIVSATDRSISGLTNFSIGGVIQTDAPINPGNSGGPLFDMNGAVVGVNSQILSASGSSSGVGFAIPSNLVQRVSQALINQGYVDYSFVGLSGGDVSLSLIEALNIPNNTQGVVVGSVEPGGPAARAGLQNATNFVTADGLEAPQQVDIITAIDGQKLRGMSDLIGYLASQTQPGDTVTLDVLRNGTDQMSLDLTLMPRH